MDQANLPTNANASSCQCGNALPHTHTREYYTAPGVPNPGRAERRHAAQMGRRPLPARRPGVSTPGEAGGSMIGNSCHFPAPAPRRIYCAPAPFTAPVGQANQLLVNAYGWSKPVTPVGMGGMGMGRGQWRR